MVKVVGRDMAVVKRKSCDGCAAILEYTLRDVWTRNGVDYTGGADGEDYIICPDCDHKVILRAW